MGVQLDNKRGERNRRICMGEYAMGEKQDEQEKTISTVYYIK